MKQYYINGLSVIDYEGNGSPLIFTHAFPLSSEMWDNQVEYFKNKFRVVTYDVRGLGKSQCPDNQFTMELFANDLMQIISELNLKNIISCGLSMGGYIILRAIIKNPDIFKAVILADTRAEGDDNDGLINRSNAIINLKNGRKKEFIDTFVKKLIDENSYRNTKLKNYIENIIERNSIEGICGSALAIATRINSVDYLNKINIPVQLIVGENDELTPIKYSEIMMSELKNSFLNIIPNSGHLSNLENAIEFNKVVENFLNRYI